MRRNARMDAFRVSLTETGSGVLEGASMRISPAGGGLTESATTVLLRQRQLHY